MMRGRVCLVTCSVYTLLAAQPVLAQNAPADAQAQPADGLDEIVVTAQKRSENLQRVPIAVTAVSGQALVNSGIKNTQDLAAIAPGLTIRKTFNNFQPYIRGIGTSASFVENPVALYVDGVYIADQRSALIELNDVEQVAVLKGPQGTLFGRNSTAGVIQITTREPSHHLTADMSAGIDNYATVRGSAYISDGLTDTVASSLSVNYVKQYDGYGRNVTTNQEVLATTHDVSVRGKLLAEPSSATKITLIGDYFNKRVIGGNQHPYRGTVYSYAGYVRPPSLYDSLSDPNRITTSRGYGTSLQVRQELGRLDLTSITAYRHTNGRVFFDADGVSIPYFSIDLPETPSNVFTQELQLASRGQTRFKWQVGGYYFNDKFRGGPSVALVNPPFVPFPAGASLIQDNAERSESASAFGQASWEFVPTLTVTGGVRYTYEKRKFDGRQLLAIVGGPTLPDMQKGSISYRKPTFRASLEWQVNPDVLGYLSFNSGFKSGGYNLLNTTAPPFLPEKLNAYEAGLKTELLGDKLRVNAAAFYYDYNNIQVFQIVNGLSIVSNAAKAKAYGLELDAQVQLAKGLRLSTGATVMKAYYVDFDGAQITILHPDRTVSVGSGDVSGNRLPNSQRFAGNVAVDYSTKAIGTNVNFNLTASYEGNYYLETDNFQKQKGYVLINSSIRFDLPGNRASLTFWGRNLADELVQTFGNTNEGASNAIYDAPPRTFGATISYRY